MSTSETTSGERASVAIIGAGPAGVYAADILAKSQKKSENEFSIDLFDRYPAPFGLIRYGVAPDHPRIKGIVKALHKVLDRGDIRFIGNVTIGDPATGADLSGDDLAGLYDAVIYATGAIQDADLNIPGIELAGSYGAADFVSWYDGHPDYPRHWPLEAEQVAVIGNGNVALDVARVLSKHAVDLLPTEIPENVYAGLAGSAVRDVHVFGRRGPAQVKFTPLELRELSHSRDVDIVLYEEDFEFDAASDEAIGSNNQVKTMVNTLTNWLIEQEEKAEGPGGVAASRRFHLHFLHAPVAILEGEDETGAPTGRVAGVRFERQELDGSGNVRGTGEYVEYACQAVYRAVGYFGSEVSGVPFDAVRGVIPNEAGRVIDESGAWVGGVYATGWIKRGPVGLIGHTKGDALETIGSLLEDLHHLPEAADPAENAVIDLLTSRGTDYTTWDGWLKLDEHEVDLGRSYVLPEGVDLPEGVERERVKVVDREDMVRISRALDAEVNS